ncbi:histidine phosphatase family protein [Tuwongella immobilis]|uniref:Histidine phosphatase family protein n=1 Tax=Tuwongella immobilis TaxID=692036 RepID=A0A6C2YT54_9BACT|nr:histidine phosphatase family protein [Tuwongella immobilis]VIP04918.1 phosphoglycerate mutase : Fructose-2,6-bisphosphatase OS=Desulfovibrio sp. U5L GN=DesU5LDRAFT_1268 PE=4 SV=1: His_Phos_1 [Tuwongella immobilis]VTS07195.1 phosphoglycerate mutase : Fructose-2,6-bisphosphatase OS=Desulfovibrio sp. U5L GN=DesU5LDRAFT_1268 PE=4 SV=1: His_Phos_1 [Tuwongella immobilis]
MIWLIRHGESQSNAGLITGPNATVELTPTGQLQAEQIAAHWHEPPDRIVISPYRRTRQTAAPLIAKFPHVPVIEAAVYEFALLNSQQFAGVLPRDRYPLVQAYWQHANPHASHGEDSESFAHFAQRAQAFLTLAESWTGTTAVFTHEQFSRMVLLSILDPAPPTTQRMRQFLRHKAAVHLPNGMLLPIQKSAQHWLAGPIHTQHLSKLTGFFTE